MSKKEVTNRLQEGEERTEDANRFEETRSMEARERQKRAIMNMTYPDPLSIGEAKAPHGMVYGWIRANIAGDESYERMTESSERGWTPVPADRHPSLAKKALFGRMDHLNGYIHRKGAILCERPEELDRLEKEKYAKMNYQVMTSMPGTDNYMGEPTIPVRNNSETYATKNART